MSDEYGILMASQAIVLTPAAHCFLEPTSGILKSHCNNVLYELSAEGMCF